MTPSAHQSAGVWRFWLGWLVSLLFLCQLFLSRWPAPAPRLIFCDVGQGDAILVTYGFWQLLVDGGPDATVLNCLDKYVPFWDRKIEILVATHPDSDHIIGLTEVMKRYRLGRVIVPPVAKNSPDFMQFRQELVDAGLTPEKIINPCYGTKVQLNHRIKAEVVSNCSKIRSIYLWESQLSEQQLSAILNSHQLEISNYNNLSIVLLLTIGHEQVLLTGDLEQDGERALLEQGVITKVDILKVGHHGSKTSSSPELLEVTQPEKAVISSGQNNSYGHPHPEVIDRLTQLGVQIMRTDQTGNIIFDFDDL